MLSAYSTTSEQLQNVLAFSAFKNYTDEQKEKLKEYLDQASFALNIAQMETLFGDSASGGMITNLIEEFPDCWEKREDNNVPIWVFPHIQPKLAMSIFYGGFLLKK